MYFIVSFFYLIASLTGLRPRTSTFANSRKSSVATRIARAYGRVPSFLSFRKKKENREQKKETRLKNKPIKTCPPT